jgi:hypothetical protein
MAIKPGWEGRFYEDFEVEIFIAVVSDGLSRRMIISGLPF